MLVVLSGPSGVGKDAALNRLRTLDRPWHFVVTATTRSMRPGERDGVDYIFLRDDRFQAMLKEGEFLEHAQVFGAHRYGTPRAPVEQRLAEGRLVILEIDVQGALQVKRTMPDALMAFIMPPGDEDLLRRLRGRGREGEEVIRSRFAEAKREIDLATSSGVYDATIVNDDLDGAIDETCRVVRDRMR